MSVKELFEAMDNFTKTPNACFTIMVFLSGSAFKIFMHIVRQTLGYGKKSDGISISQFVEFTGVSKSQVMRSIEELKKLKVITVKHQQNKSGGKSYNRYSLNLKGIDTLVSKWDKGSTIMKQGVVSKRDKGSAIMEHTKENRQNTIEQKKRKRDISEEENKDFLFLRLTERLQKKFLDEYIQHLINESEYIKSETAFKIAIKKKLDKLDKNQLQDFEEWFLSMKSEILSKEYQGVSVLIDNCTAQIKEVYPYFKTQGYIDDYNLYMSFVSNECEDIKPIGFKNETQIREFIKVSKRR